MVVNDTALCAAMKKAWKDTGYKVAAEADDGNVNIMIAAPGWCVVIRKSKMPRKVLGLIVEHVGDIPRVGEAYQVQKKQVQTEIHSVTTQILERLRDEKLVCRTVKPTNLTWNGYRLYQRPDDLKLVKVDPAYGDIMIHAAGLAMLGDDVLTVSGLASDVYIDREMTLWEELAQLNHLAQMQWV